MSSEAYHEPFDMLPTDVVDRHRAITSIMEEIEAVDWYDQRVAATSDASLAAVLAHNRDEEKEHLAMVIEWLRRHDAVFDDELRTYLFTEGPIVGIEHAAEQGGSAEDTGPLDAGIATTGSTSDGSLGIGSLRGA